MKRMRSKTVLLDVFNVEADDYILPNHEDYQYIDIHVSKTTGEDAQYVRVYKEKTLDIVAIPNYLHILKTSTYLVIRLEGSSNYNIFAVGWK